jgi:hypothetical protein
MMTSRERVIRALSFQPIDRAPRDLWVVPATEFGQPEDVTDIRFRYPSDIVRPEGELPPGDRSLGVPYEPGEYVDAWGCRWQVAQRGMMGDVHVAPLTDDAQIAAYRPPDEVLDRFDAREINRSCATTSRFALAWSDVRPFERLQFLRGREAALVDMATGSQSLRSLLAMVHDYNCRELARWAASDVDGVVFRDNLGSQQSLLVSPEIWRDLFRPLYRDYCKILHDGDKFAFFHSDGNIADIFDDLVALGIDAIHCELFRMNIETLAQQYRDRITFWGEIDRVHTLPQGKPEEIRAAVRRVRAAFDYGRGGVIAQCEWAPGIAFRNIAALYEEWLAPMPMHAAEHDAWNARDAIA